MKVTYNGEPHCIAIEMTRDEAEVICETLEAAQIECHSMDPKQKEVLKILINDLCGSIRNAERRT